MNNSWAPLLAVFFWSGNFIITKLAASSIEPGAIGFYRSCVAVLVMTPFLLPAVVQKRTQVVKYLPKLAILGLFGTAMYQGLSYAAAKTTTAINMGIIASSIPLFTIMLSRFYLNEKVRIEVAIGCVISLVGLFILITQGNWEVISLMELNYGDALILIASVFYALYCVLLQRWIFPLSIWESLYIQSLWATIQLLPVYYFTPSSQMTNQNIGIILYAGILASVIAPLFWMRGISSLGPNRASVFMNLFPLITAAIAIAVLNETAQLYHLAGGILTLTGVALAQTNFISSIVYGRILNKENLCRS